MILKFIKLLLFIVFLTAQNTYTQAQNMYFPPLTGNAWDTLSPSSLGWCRDRIDTLYRYLEQENTKAFIVLKDGKIVLEKYFGTFTGDSSWYWASAGKTITAFLVGKAQEEGMLSISDSTSKYLGSGWTSCTPQQEGKITIRHQITMTTGLDDNGDVYCSDDTCLRYLADPGTRWAYHNGPYSLLKEVLEAASGVSDNIFTTTRLKQQTGMTGIWITAAYNNVFYSKPRSMARFGLLIQNRGIWNSDTLLHDTAYYNQMIHPSQNLNRSYGYLWWLNGQPSYMVPGAQVVIPGAYAPDAPADMYAALGKNGQIISISPSKGLVIIRMGESPGNTISDVSTVFCNDIWKKMNDVMCAPNSIRPETGTGGQLNVYPNPAASIIHIKVQDETADYTTEVCDLLGQKLLAAMNTATMDISSLPAGIYLIRVKQGDHIFHRKIQKN